MAFLKGLYLFSLCFLLYSPCFFPRDASDNMAWYLLQLHWLLQNPFCPSPVTCPCVGCKGECFPSAGSRDGPRWVTALSLPSPEKWMLTAVSQETGVYLPAPSASQLAWIKGCHATRSVRRGPLSLKCLTQGRGWDMVWAECLHCDSHYAGTKSVSVQPDTALWGLAENFGFDRRQQYLHQCCRSFSKSLREEREHSCASPNWGSRVDPQIGGQLNTMTERGSSYSSLSCAIWVSR